MSTLIRRRVNWGSTEETPLTLEEVGSIIGVTNERVRPGPSTHRPIEVAETSGRSQTAGG